MSNEGFVYLLIVKYLPILFKFSHSIRLDGLADFFFLGAGGDFWKPFRRGLSPISCTGIISRSTFISCSLAYQLGESFALALKWMEACSRQISLY